MDRLDEEIIYELKEDGRMTVREIAKRLSLPMSTVHHRIKQLEKGAIIKKYTIEPDYKRMGFGVSAYVMVTVDYSKTESQEEVAREISHLENVDEVCIITGEIDIIARIRARSIEELNDIIVRRLRAISGVEKTFTSVVLNEIV